MEKIYMQMQKYAKSGKLFKKYENIFKSMHNYELVCGCFCHGCLCCGRLCCGCLCCGCLCCGCLCCGCLFYGCLFYGCLCSGCLCFCCGPLCGDHLCGGQMKSKQYCLYVLIHRILKGFKEIYLDMP